MRPDCATRSYPPTPRPASGGRPWRAKGWRRSCLPGWRVSQGPYRRDRGAGLCSFLLPFEFLSGSCWLMVRVEVSDMRKGRTNMRAMRAEQFSGYEALKLVELPKPAVADGKVLVRITAAGVTPLDHTILSGQFHGMGAPLILGNEGAGVVEEGGGAEFPAGSRVMF